ncbi:MAG: prepilin-type N-terminal cleavage/methylation domain-containing protein [Patescibacteria group bacterium]
MTNKGFTFIEIIIAVAILVLIFGLGGNMGLNFYRQYLREQSKSDLTTILKKARSRAMADINQSNHGVYVGENQYILFQGSSYLSRTTEYDQAFDKASGISASGLDEIVFERFRGNSSASSTIILTDVFTNKTKTIEINYEGRIN